MRAKCYVSHEDFVQRAHTYQKIIRSRQYRKLLRSDRANTCRNVLEQIEINGNPCRNGRVWLLYEVNVEQSSIIRECLP